MEFSGTNQNPLEEANVLIPETTDNSLELLQNHSQQLNSFESKQVEEIAELLVASTVEMTIPLVEEITVMGDITGDGGLDFDDARELLRSYRPEMVDPNDPRDINGDGRLSLLDVRELGIIVRDNTDQNAPNLLASLVNDTGSLNNDQLTSDPSISGTLSDDNLITRFSAGFGNTSLDNYVNILGVLNENGLFSLDEIQLQEINNNNPLLEGEHTLHLFTKDQWNNITTLDIDFVLDRNAPDIGMSLLNDTGSSNNDLITNDIAISGTVNDASSITELKAGFDDALEGDFIDVLDQLQTDGSFNFDAAKLQEINDNIELSQGEHTLKILATDEAGNTSEVFEFTFTLDSETPTLTLDTPVNNGEISEGDSITGNTNGTGSEITSISYQFDAGVTIPITVDNDGNFDQELDLTGLGVGEHILTLTIVDVAGNETVSSLTLNIPAGDTTPPNITAMLVNDTGSSNNDLITNNPEISGTVNDVSSITEFKAGFDDAIEADFIDVLDQLQPDGSFNFDAAKLQEINDNTELSQGEHTLKILATDEAGNTSEVFEFTFTLDSQSPSLTINEPVDNGEISEGDSITGNTNGTGSEIASISYQFDAGVTIPITVDNDGNFDQELDLTGLEVGEHILTLTTVDIAGNETVSSLSINVSALDTQPPVPTLTSSLNDGTTLIDINFGETIVNATDLNNYTLTVVGGIRDGEIIGISSINPLGSQGVRLTLNEGLVAGENYRLEISSNIEDVAGNNLPENTSLDLALTPPSITEITPANGAEMVPLTRETVVRFNVEIDPDTVTEESLYLIANGQRIAGRRVVSSTNKFVTFFYDEPLPSSTEIRVVVDGDKITTMNGVAIDADGDGNLGGIVTVDFSTLPITRIEGTDVFGYVFDSFNTDENGENIPVVGATIRLDALPNVFAVTDETGFFRLEDVPAPEFSVHIDGGTATNAPEGTVYATVGKIFHSIPGQETQLIMDGETFDVFLPPMATADIQPLAAEADTDVGFGEASKAQLEALFPEVDPELWDQVIVTFPAGSAQDEEGNVATQGAIIPVAPDRLPAPLPGGVDPQLVISVQAGGEGGFSQTEGGATNFDIPAPLQFPNLDGLAPGAKATIWSFNHDSGEWETVGLGTVSEDGMVIVSDEGVGILAPGWHFVSPPLNWTGSGGSPQGNNPVNQMSPPVISQMLSSTAGGNSISFTFNPPPGPGQTVGNHQLPQGTTQPTRVIDMTVEGPLKDYYKADQGGGVRTKTWTLKPGDAALTVSSIQKDLNELKTDLNAGKLFEENIIYGSKIIVEEILTLADGSTQKSTRIIFPYMLIDATDPGKEDLKLQFAQTINDGGGNVVRDLPLKIQASASSNPTLSLTNSSHYLLANALQEIWFDPTAEGNSLTSAIQIKNPLNAGLAGNINLEGKGVKKQGWRIDAASYENQLKAIADDNGTTYPRVLAADKAVIDTKAERDQLLVDIRGQITTLYSNFSSGIFEASSAGDNVLTIIFEDHANPAPGDGWSLGLAPNSLNNLNNINRANILDAYTNRNNYSQLERAYRAADDINNVLGGSIKVYFDNYLEGRFGLDNSTKVKNTLGKTGAHEIGHHIGLYHTGSSSTVRIAGGANDIMRQGLDLTGSRRFEKTKEPVKMALHIEYTGDEADKTIAYYAAYQAAVDSLGKAFDTEGGNDLDPHSNDEVGPEFFVFTEPTLGLFSAEDSLITSEYNLGSVIADGLGGETIDTSWLLMNLGPETLGLTNINLSDNDTVIEVFPDLAGTLLTGDETAELNFLFDPIEAGEFSRDVTIIADNGEEYTINVTATAIDPDPVFDIGLLNNNNNFGGLGVNQSTLVEDFLTITNQGAADLIFTPTVTNGALDFDLGAFEGIEQTLAFGESLVIPVTFDPSTTGLLPGMIQFTTNDPDATTFNQGIVGTGIPVNGIEFDWGDDFVVIEYNDFVERLTSNDAGDFMLSIPTFTEYDISIFDPVSGLIATGGGFTGPAGAFTDLTSSLAFLPSTANDQDFDGLPDDVEWAIGTSLSNIDTDNDQLSDFTEIEQGLDPLGGQGFPTGIIASLPLLGEANAVVVEGSTENTRNQLAYVATGSHGLAIVDASQFDNPIVLGQLNLNGSATDVAVDSNLGIAAVATNSAGLQLVDVSDPMLPTLIQTVNISNVREVEIADGVAYAVGNNTLQAIDLLTGQQINSLILPGFGTVTDIARDGTNLYTFSSGSDTFTSIDISSPETLTILGQTNVSIASFEVGLSVGNGLAYLAGSGLSSVDISDPANPSLISGADNFFTAREIARNGSGLGLVAAEGQGVALYDISDPNDTDTFITRFDTPGFTNDIAIASGIAYVADGSGDLQVINYLSFDNQGIAPTVTISSNADSDPNTPGIQVLEGTSVPIQVDVIDDVQVRNVALLVNGEVVSNDVSFPFDLSAIALADEPEATTATVQVHATDTGGNTTLSNLLTLEITPDTFAPFVTSSTPNEGARLRSISALTVRFSEAIDESLLNVNGVTLTNFGEDGILGTADDISVTPDRLQLSESGNNLAIFAPDGLPFVAGEYQLELDSSIISDRAGNQLNDPFTLNFTQRDIGSIVFGELVEGNIVNSGEDEIFTFTGEIGQRIFFDGISTDNFNLTARLVSPSGVDIFNFQSLSSDRNPVTLIEQGTYQIIVDDEFFNDGTGDFSFQLLDASSATPLMIDTPVMGDVAQNTTELFTFAGTAGDRIVFNNLDDDFSGSLTVYDPGNQSSFTSFSSPITLESTGTYLVALSTFNFGTNTLEDYNFEVIFPVTTVAPLTIGETITGDIDAVGNEDIYTFEGTAGQQLYFDALPSDFEFLSGISITSPSGGSIPNFFGGATTSDSSPFTLIEDGTYELTVRGFNTTGDYSFRLLDFANATAVNLDTLVEGTLTPGNSTELFSFEGTEDQLIFLDHNSFSTILALYGPSNQFLGNQGSAEITLPGDSSYFLFLRGFDRDNPVDYGFTVETPDIIPDTLTIGSTVNGTIANPGEQIHYSFEGTKGQRVIFDGLDNTFNFNTRLLSPSNQPVFNFNQSTSTSGDGAPITLLETGTYELIVDAFGVTTGDFSFRVLDFADATDVTLDLEVSGTLEPGQETQLFAFEGQDGQTLLLDDSSGNSFGGSYTIYNGANEFLTSSSLGFDTTINLTGDGTYFILVQGFSTIPVEYTFQLTETAFDDPGDPMGTEIMIGETVNSDISANGEVDTYLFEGTAGQTLIIDGLSNNSFPVRVTSPTTNFPDFSSVTSSDSRPVTLLEDGIYQLTVEESSGIGDYSFRILDTANATPITPDTVVGGTLDPSRSAEIFTFEGTEGQQLFLDIDTTNFNYFASIYSPNNQFLSSGDQLFTISGDGTYTVILGGNTFDETPVDYSFQLLTPTITETPLTIGDTVTGSINQVGEVDIYTFEATPGQRLYFDGLDQNFVANVTLSSPSGANIPNLSFSVSTTSNSSPFTLIEGGNYELRVLSGNNTGDYNFRLLDIADATPIDLNTTVEGILDPGRETQLFTFEGTENQGLVLEREFFGANYTVYSPGNQFIVSSNSDFTLPGDGTYLVEVAGFSFNNTPIDYNFRVQETTVIPVSLTLGNTVNGTIANIGDRIAYTFEGAVGQRLIYDGISGNFGIDAQLVSPSGNNIFSFFNPNVNSDQNPITLIEDGTYTLFVDASGTNTGDFSFRLSNGNTAPLLNFNTTIQGTLEPNTIRVLRFNGVANQTISLEDLGSDSFTGDFRLIGPGNQLITSSRFGSNLEATLPGNGTYFLLLDSFSNNPANYRFRVV